MAIDIGGSFLQRFRSPLECGLVADFSCFEIMEIYFVQIDDRIFRFLSVRHPAVMELDFIKFAMMKHLFPEMCKPQPGWT